MATTRAARATYHGPSGSSMSEGLRRARAPFAVRNALTGSLIFVFATSVYLYSISKVKQDDFSDLVLPASTPEEREKIRTIEDGERDREAAKKAAAQGALLAVPGLSRPSPAPEAALSSTQSSTWADKLRTAFPGRGADSWIVVGAPPVDRLGKLGDAPSVAAAARGRP